MATSLFRIIRYGVQSFWRNKWLSSATIAVMVLALLVFSGLILFSVLTNNALAILRDKIDVNVYFKDGVSEDSILKLKRSLATLPEVKDVEYISKEQALQQFQERYKDDAVVQQAVSILDSNPLSASLNIKAHDPTQYPIIASYLGNQDLKDLVDQVNFAQTQIVIGRLAAIVDTVQRSGIALTVVLAIVAVLVTLNTIMLTIYSTRNEIGIMRLVGASNEFIRGPYLVQGVMYGIIAAFLSLLVMMPIVYASNPYIKILMPGVDMQSYFYSHLPSLLLYQLAFGIVLGVISSGIAVARYLNV